MLGISFGMAETSVRGMGDTLKNTQGHDLAAKISKKPIS
jgi:hypothetical protein